jgi:hypothetical protein
MVRPPRFGALLFLAGCGIDDFETVLMDEATLPATRTPGVPVQGIYGDAFNALELSQAKSFQNAGVKPGDVDGIYAKSIELEMDTGSNNPAIDKLSIYVDSLELWVEAPGEARKVVARETNMPEAKTVSLPIEADFAVTASDSKGTGFKPYAVAESMTFGANLVLTPAGADPFLNIRLTTTVTLLIDIDILGI